MEFDPSVSVVHRHPLQNRTISPKMRIITRHSKLLYFCKHLPRWEFWTLSGIVALEAAVRGGWSRCLGRQDEVRAWQTIAEVARRLRRGMPLRGRAILELAETATTPNREGEAEPPSPETRRLAPRIGTDASRKAAVRRCLARIAKGWNRVTTLQHAARIGLLMAGAAALLGWEIRHTEATFADGLRYIHRAEQIEGGSWTDGVLDGIDHPLHPLGIVAAHDPRRRRSGLLAPRCAGTLLRLRGAPGHPDLSPGPGALRRTGGVARLRAGVAQSRSSATSWSTS